MPQVSFTGPARSFGGEATWIGAPSNERERAGIDKLHVAVANVVEALGTHDVVVACSCSLGMADGRPLDQVSLTISSLHAL